MAIASIYPMGFTLLNSLHKNEKHIFRIKPILNNLLFARLIWHSIIRFQYQTPSDDHQISSDISLLSRIFFWYWTITCSSDTLLTDRMFLILKTLRRLLVPTIFFFFFLSDVDETMRIYERGNHQISSDIYFIYLTLYHTTASDIFWCISDTLLTHTKLILLNIHLADLGIFSNLK